MCNFPESTDTTLLLITTFSQRKRGINGYKLLVAHRLKLFSLAFYPWGRLDALRTIRLLREVG